MVWTRDKQGRLRIPKCGGRVKIHREETERTSKEAMDRKNKAELRKIWDTKLGRKSIKSKRVEGDVGGGKTF